MTETYFAQITDGIVTSVHVVSQEFINANPERYTGTWVETFIDNPDKTYAGIGYTYDATTQKFVAPQPAEPLSNPITP